MPQKPLQFVHGFTLIELLAVIAISSLLMSLTVVGFQNLVFSRQAPQAADEIAGIIRAARAFAVAQNTYAVVGLRNAVRDSDPVLEVGTFYSLDGIEPVAGSQASSTLAPRGKLVRFKQLNVQPQAGNLDSALLAAVPPADRTVGLGDETTFAAPSPHGTFQWRLLITPSGEISLKEANALIPAAIIGLARVRSTSGSIPPANVAVIVRGVIGQASSVHP